MVCMDGFVLTHAFEAVDVPDAGAGRRVPAAVRARARCSTRTHPSRSARWSGRRRSPRSATSCTPSRCRRSTRSREIAGEFAAAFGRDSGGLVRAYRTRGRRDRRRRARLGARARSRTSSTSCASEGVAIGALGITLLPAVPARRGARGAGATRRRVVVLEKAFAVGVGGIVGQNVRARAGRARRRGHDVVAGLGGRADHHALAARAARRRAGGRARAATAPSSTSTARSSSASCADRERRRSGPHAENMLRDSASRPGSTRRRAMPPADQVLPGRHASRPATGCSTRSSASVQADARSAPNALTSGHRACQGCGEALGARYVARRRDARDRRQAWSRSNATGCLEVFSTPYPEIVVAAAVAALAVRQRAGGRHRRRGRAEGQGPRRHPRGRPGRRRRHRRHRLRLPVRHVRAQRRRALRLLRQRGAT